MLKYIFRNSSKNLEIHIWPCNCLIMHDFILFSKNIPNCSNLKACEAPLHANIYILSLFTEKPFSNSKPLERNVVYIPITTSSQVSLMTSNKTCLSIAFYRILETVVTFHFSGGKVYSLNKGCLPV